MGLMTNHMISICFSVGIPQDWLMVLSEPPEQKWWVQFQHVFFFWKILFLVTECINSTWNLMIRQGVGYNAEICWDICQGFQGSMMLQQPPWLVPVGSSHFQSASHCHSLNLLFCYSHSYTKGSPNWGGPGFLIIQHIWGLDWFRSGMRIITVSRICAAVSLRRQ
jgi:hypothetical protein